MTAPRARLLPCAAFLLGAALTACGGGPTVVEDVELEIRTLEVGRDVRGFHLYVPPSARSGGPAPLILVFHGAAQTLSGIEQMSWLFPAASEAGAIVAYLRSVGEYWNTPASPPSYWSVNDLGFAREVVETLVSEGRADPERIYATGFSNGAVFAQVLACAAPETLAAVAVVGATMSRDLAGECDVDPPLPFLLFLGDADSQFFWDDGFASNFRMFGGPASARWWAEADGCGIEPAIEALPDLEDDATAVERWNFSGCSGDVDVSFYRVLGGGHTWPGSPLRLSGLGPKTNDIDASRLMVDFFLRWARPGAGS